MKVLRVMTSVAARRELHHLPSNKPWEPRMLSDKSMVCLKGLPIIIVMLIFLASSGGCASTNRSTDKGHSWSLEDEVAFYREAIEPSEESAILPYLINAAEQSAYTDWTARVALESGRCDSWIVVQSINIGDNQFDATLFCKDAGSWTKVVREEAADRLNVDAPDAAVLSGVLSSFDDNIIVDADCDAILDATSVYVSVFNGTKVFRYAAYAPQHIVGGCRDSTSARKVATDIDLLRESIDGGR